ncbi:MAG: excinuclease ABC subunit UvrA [Phycisphaerales bacterium]|nr:excinuclease ABC subunit UvrA [Phycisphaerales bacterium]
MVLKHIRIQGAREHNLKNVTLEIPRDQLIVFTGLSGSGKSSLAFDTIYAEGQRKYMESLSSYARQFLDLIQKPDCDEIEGLPPTIAIEQRQGSSNPRSTVATTTEIYDYLRVLFARAGTPHCWVCGQEIASQSATQIVEAVMKLAEGTKVMILSPLVRGQKGTHKEVLEAMTRQGFVRCRVDGVVCEIKDALLAIGKTGKTGIVGKINLDKNLKHTVEAVVDRLIIKEEIRTRLADSVELALKLADGLLVAMVEEPAGSGKWIDRAYSSKYACADHPEASLEELSPRLFSFNSPYGACPSCLGLGTIQEFDEELIVPDRSLPVSEAIEPFRRNGRRMNIWYNRMMRIFCSDFDVDEGTPFSELPEKTRKILMYGTTSKDEASYRAEFEGVLPVLQRRWENTDSEFVKARLHQYMSEQPCEKCQGKRLRTEALAVKIGGKNIQETTSLTIERALEFFSSLKLETEQAQIAAPVLKEVRSRLGFMSDVGLGYLSLDRQTGTLSGGEFQRIRLATQVGSGLVGVAYVLDEPTIGLHQRDNDRLIKTLRHLTDIGNTVIVVEHDEDTIRAADWVIDVGPGAGSHGGKIIAEGSVQKVLASTESITAKYLTGECQIVLPKYRRAMKADECVEVIGAKENNLKKINVKVPLGGFVCVTGVSGSGKSTLVNEIILKGLRRKLYGSKERPGEHTKLLGTQYVDKVIEIDQSPIGRTPRSNPATYTGVFDLIRTLYSKTREAKIRGYKSGRFSFNVKGGRCESCQGQGTKRIEMHFLPDVFVTCEACKGTRFNRETLEIKYRGKSIADVLSMRVEEALAFFDSFNNIKQILQAMNDVGLSYVELGQSSTTLSGGEAQRVKLASELGKPATGHTLYVLDEPTTGLHFADIHNLLNVLNRLVDQGNTVLVIEHNLDVIKCADWIIDLGPEGGEGGGTIVDQGTPEKIVENPQSFTGQYLKHKLTPLTIVAAG